MWLHIPHFQSGRFARFTPRPPNATCPAGGAYRSRPASDLPPPGRGRAPERVARMHGQGQLKSHLTRKKDRRRGSASCRSRLQRQYPRLGLAVPLDLAAQEELADRLLEVNLREGEAAKHVRLTPAGRQGAQDAASAAVHARRQKEKSGQFGGTARESIRAQKGGKRDAARREGCSKKWGMSLPCQRAPRAPGVMRLCCSPLPMAAA